MKKKVLLIITLLIAAFIFLQSALPGSESQAESDSIFIIFDSILKFLHIPNFFDEGSIRKLAHFVEFSFWGFFLSATVHAYSGFRGQIYKIMFFLLALPVSDELLQSFSDGRSSQIKDVLIDFSGGIFGFACLSILLYLNLKTINIKKNTK